MTDSKIIQLASERRSRRPNGGRMQTYIASIDGTALVAFRAHLFQKLGNSWVQMMNAICFRKR